MIRDRIFSGGVAVIADTWYQAKTALDKMPIEWDVPPEHAALNTANMRAALMAALDKPGKVRVNLGDCDSAFARGARIVEATYSTPYLPRARMEPGNATVLVTDDRVDIWIGDQSPQETRYSASQITGIPEENVYLHLCHLGGGFGRNGNGPQAEQAIYIANQNRGTPIHLLWTREEDFISTTYRSMGVARLRAALDADGWPIAIEVRTAMDEKAPGADRRVRQGLALLRAELPLLDPQRGLPHSRGHAARRRRSRRTISIARASWTSSPTRPARTRISIAAN